MKYLVACFTFGLSLLLPYGPPALLVAAELVRLSPETWDEYAPQGKEIDCIYGDLVLRNDQLIVVIGNPIAGRHANMTVKNVGGCIIDLTRRESANDQLSAYYPCGSRYTFTDPNTLKIAVDEKPAELGETSKLSGKSISMQLTAAVDSTPEQILPRVTLRYTLSDGEPFLRVETTHHNGTSKPLVESFNDSIRADKVFRLGTDDKLFQSAITKKTNLFWASDEWFGQSYGVVCDGRQVRITGQNRTQLELVQDGEAQATIPPGEKIVISRKIFPSANLFEVRAVAQQLASIASREISVRVVDTSDPNVPGPPIAHALVGIDDARPTEPPPAADNKNIPGKNDRVARETTVTPPAPQPIEKTYPQASYGLARTDAHGYVRAQLPQGTWKLIVRAIGRPEVVRTIKVEAGEEHFGLDAAGYVAARITDDRGQPIPCKVIFFGKDGTEDPFFGPDTGEVAVHNAYYSHTGRFRQEIAPGRYDVIISYGPEFDAVFTEIDVKRGQETPLSARLIRTVDTHGWVSTDFHSHSSPSGDNVSSQTGRVLNLLCEHIEFAPCTEHNRIDSYVPILKRLGIEPQMATCSGMELTGSPLPVNHQNAFPLVHKPRTQDGGAPTIHLNPVLQIERLALWDGKSEKLVQGNHPNLPQILGDRDLNGQPDEGFREMFGFMDVVEIHPPELIFTPPTQLDASGKAPRNPIFHWMQMLNLGYRIPGVVNTDAHYNFHGSGGLRNYVKCSTDSPGKIDTMEMVRESEAGHITVTNGPFLEVSARAVEPVAAGDDPMPANRNPNVRVVGGAKAESKTAIPGDDLVAPGGEVALSIRVQCPNWFDINRVQVFLNGRPEKQVNFTRRENPQWFSKKAVRFEATVPLKLSEDTHVIVAAAGEGETIGPVMGPAWGKKMPIAVSNPIFVDVDGKGFQPNGDRLGVPLPLEESFRHEHHHGKGPHEQGSARGQP